MVKEFSYSYGNYYAKDRFVKMRFDIFKDLLMPYLEKNIKILDIGCYDGAMLEALKSITKDIDYTGVDADLIALTIASNRGAKIIHLNFETATLPFRDNSFDIVIMGEILEHLRNPAKLMEQTKAVLKPGGKILISLPNECTLYHRLKMLLGKGVDGTGFKAGYHLHFPTIQQNRDFVLTYFNIIKQEYWYHLGVGGVIEKLLSLIPKFMIEFFIHVCPSLFARGVIYLCEK